MNKAVFLDRDGVVNEDYGFVHRIEDFRFIKGSVEALKALSESKFKVVIVTDQSGIGRGLYLEEEMHKLHHYMLNMLSRNGIIIDRIYHCPHSPEERCKCRKPQTLLLEKAKDELDLKLEDSYFVGDKTKDIQTGKNAHCKTIMVSTGVGGKDREYNVAPDWNVSNLLEAVNIIIANEKQG